VCQHPQRLDIELALLEGQSGPVVAERFSTGDQVLNRQNLHTHYRNHMKTIDRAVFERARTRNALLDVQTGRGIRQEEDELLELLSRYVRAAMAEGAVRVSVRDVLRVTAERARIEQERSRVQVEAVVVQARAFGEAVRNVAPEELHEPIIVEYDRLMTEKTPTGRMGSITPT
jgi:hypothetical protein